MKNEKPYIVYTDDPALAVTIDEKLDSVLESLEAVKRRLNIIESDSWVTTDRISDDAVTGAKIAPFEDWTDDEQ